MWYSMDQQVGLPLTVVHSTSGRFGKLNKLWHVEGMPISWLAQLIMLWNYEIMAGETHTQREKTRQVNEHWGTVDVPHITNGVQSFTTLVKLVIYIYIFFVCD